MLAQPRFSDRCKRKQRRSWLAAAWVAQLITCGSAVILLAELGVFAAEPLKEIPYRTVRGGLAQTPEPLTKPEVPGASKASAPTAESKPEGAS